MHDWVSRGRDVEKRDEVLLVLVKFAQQLAADGGGDLGERATSAEARWVRRLRRTWNAPFECET